MDMAGKKHVLDARGLLCPLPVLKARQRLRTLQPGEQLVTLTTDPGAEADFVALATARNCRIVACEPCPADDTWPEPGLRIVLQLRESD